MSFQLCGISVPLRYFSLCCLTAQTTAAVILTRYSKTMLSPDAEPYNNSSLVVSTEVAKLTLSLLFVFIFDVSDNKRFEGLEGLAHGDHTTGAPEELKGIDRVPLHVQWGRWKWIMYEENFRDWSSTIKLSIPALLYTIQNTVIYIALNNLEATTFQVGYQSKVVTTAIMSVLMLNRSLSYLKWFSLFLLSMGIVLTQLKTETPTAPTTTSLNSSNGVAQTDNDPLVGIVSVLTAATLSAFAGVYFEKVLKGSAPSVWVRNAQLASFSTIIGVTMYLLNGNDPRNFFTGYGWMVITLIGVQAAGGLIIAVVVKYADNILKGFATALSILLCGAISSWVMGFLPTIWFLFGSAVVIGATMMYSVPDKK